MTRTDSSFDPPDPALANRAARIDWIRRAVIRLSYAARSAHLGSSLSCVEIIDAILSAGSFERNAGDGSCGAVADRLIVSKGHAAMATYAAMAAHGLLAPELLDRYLEDGSTLWGHVTRTPIVPAIAASTGSLGHGLGLACGHTYGDRLRGAVRRCFVVLSDGECDEGSTWESASFAGHHGLAAITAVIDYNKIQSLDHCEAVLTKKPLAARWQAFGWIAETVDGHDAGALEEILHRSAAQPRIIIADTVKGRGIPRIEDSVASHYHPATEDDLEADGR